MIPALAFRPPGAQRGALPTGLGLLAPLITPAQTLPPAPRLYGTDVGLAAGFAPRAGS